MNTHCNQFRAALYCALGTAALAALSTSVKATEQDIPTKVVRFDDLNLENSAGARALYSRIHAAAREVCGWSASPDRILTAAVQSCIDKAMNDAVLHVNAPVLNALHFGGGIRLASE